MRLTLPQQSNSIGRSTITSLEHLPWKYDLNDDTRAMDMAQNKRQLYLMTRLTTS